MAPGDLVTEYRADRAVDVLDGEDDIDRPLMLQSLAAEGHDGRPIERLLKPVVLLPHLAYSHLRSHLGLIENAREIETSGLPVIDRSFDLEPIDPPDQLVHAPETKLGHILARLLSN